MAVAALQATTQVRQQIEERHLSSKHVHYSCKQLADDRVANDRNVNVALLQVLQHLPPRVLMVRAPWRLKYLRTR